MKELILGVFFIMLCISCTDSEEGLIGEWEGKTERVNSDGELIEANISCVVRSNSGTERSMVLTVAGAVFEFIAIENMNTITYKDSQVMNDSTGRSYITGYAELLNDTLLHFDHSLYAMKDSALLYSDDYLLDMVRK